MMKPLIIIIALLTYAFVDFPLEITNNFLAYLIPFIIAIIGLLICIKNFSFIRTSQTRFKKALKVANIITILVFSFLIVYDFPMPENGGLRCKNWTDTGMVVNLNDNSEQYVSQEMEISGSIFDFRSIKVKPINQWIRWRFIIDKKPQSGNWLYIDNSDSGENSCPFPLNQTKIDFERDKGKTRLVTLENGVIKK